MSGLPISDLLNPPNLVKGTTYRGLT